jgi:hypothetical protein
LFGWVDDSLVGWIVGSFTVSFVGHLGVWSVCLLVGRLACLLAGCFDGRFADRLFVCFIVWLVGWSLCWLLREKLPFPLHLWFL